MTAQPVPEAFAQALRELGLAGDEALLGEPLAGGVSSDIWRVDTAAGPVCVKRALARLRVAADWRAPIVRNRYEARWYEVANAAVPGCAPRVLGQHEALGVLAMSWLPPDGHRLWKDLLREGRADALTARAVGAMLVKVHAWSAARARETAPRFDSDAIFFDIRLEPYLLATAQRHADLAGRLQALVERTRREHHALVHGDVSPKNILIDARGSPVLLDAECAWWGDPAFDLAFCLNHLLLKCLWNPAARGAYGTCFSALSNAYLGGVDWEPREAIEARAASLLPGLLMARVDGKSPVEYVSDEAGRETVRRVARALLQHPPSRLQPVCAAWHEELLR